MKVRPFTDKDWPEFVGFSAKYFGPSHLPESSFNEHWFRTPWHKEWAVRVLENDAGRIVGIAMVIVVPGKFGGSEVPFAWISSMAVEEDVRVKGGGALFYLWIYKSFPIVGAMSGNENSIPINSLLGIEIPGVNMRRFICVHDKRTVNLCLPSQRDRVLAGLTNSSRSLKGTLVSRWSPDIPSDYDQLWTRFRKKFFCTTERNRQYMEWRYLRAPHMDYRLLEMRSRGDLVALAAVRFQRTPEGPVCRMVDFITDERWTVEAWYSVADVAATQGALFTDFMVVGTSEDEHMKRAGFLPADSTTGLDAVPHLLSPVEHRRWSNTFHLGGRLARADDSWRLPCAVYFTKGDSDRDWPTSYDLNNKTHGPEATIA